MCLILLAYQPNEHHRLIVAANRDEFYARPSTAADFWEDAPGVLAGRDLEAGGTWLGVDRAGRFAAVTNFRRSASDLDKPRSRGELTQGFLSSDLSAADYFATISPHLDQYRGFNLILMDETGLFYGNNTTGDLAALSAGYYGLSNQRLDCDWPKVTEGRDRLSTLTASHPIDSKALLRLLRDTGDHRPFSNSFIASEEYGTCVSTLVQFDREGGVEFLEQGFHPGGVDGECVTFSLAQAS